MKLGAGSLADLARLRDFRRGRLSSWDRRGGNRDFLTLPPGETASLGEIEGAGCVKHWWVTLTSLPADPFELGSAVLRRFDPRYRFSTWLYTIALRLACDRARQQRRRGADVGLDAASARTPGG